MCCLLCITTSASHQYVSLGCYTAMPLEENHLCMSVLSRPVDGLWRACFICCLVLKEMDIKFYLLPFPLPVLHHVFVCFYCYRKTGYHMYFFATCVAFKFKCFLYFQPHKTPFSQDHHSKWNFITSSG